MLPARVMCPRCCGCPEEHPLGVIPSHDINPRALANRAKSPISAISPKAVSVAIPRKRTSTRTWSAHRPSLARAVRLRGLPSALSVDLPRELELGVVEIRQTYVCPRQTESFGHAGAGESGQGQWGSVGLGRAVIVCLSSSPSKIRRRFVCEGFGRSHVSVRETELLRAV